MMDALIPNLVAVLLSTGIMGLCWRSFRVPGARWLLGVLLAVFLGALSNGILSMSINQIQDPFWAFCHELAVLFAPTLWLAFSLEFSSGKLVRQKTALLLLIFPIFSAIIILTNHQHNLWITDPYSPYQFLSSYQKVGDYGVWFWITMLYNFIILVTSTYKTGLFIRRQLNYHRMQAIILILGLASLWVFHILDIVLTLPTGLDLTIWGTLAAGLIFCWGLLNYDTFAPAPLARDTLMDYVQDMMLVLDKNHRIIDVNQIVPERLGISIVQIVGRPVVELLPDVEIFLVDPQHPHEQICIFNIHLRAGEFWVEMRAVPLFQNYHQYHGQFLVLHDITERRVLEMALRNSEEKYRNLVERSNDAVVILQDWIIRYANLQMAAMLKCSLNELINKPFLDFVAPEQKEMIRDRYERRLRGDVLITRYELTLINRLEEKILVEINIGIMDYETRPALMGTLRDITRFKETQERLEDEIKSRQQAQISMRRYSWRLNGLRRIDQAVLSASTPVEIARSALDNIRPVLPFDYGMVGFIHRERNEVHILTENLPGSYPQDDYITSMDACLIPPEIFGGKVIIYHHLLEELHLPPQHLLTQHTILSYLAAPLMIKGELIGILALGSKQINAFHREYIQIAGEIADSLAIGLYSANLYAETLQHLTYEQHLNEISRVLSANLDLDAVLENLACLTAESLNADVCMITILDRDSRSAVISNLYHAPEELRHYRVQRGEGLFWQVIETGKPIIINDYLANPMALTHLKKLGVQTMLAVPILSGDTVMGTMALFNKSASRPFTQRDQHLAEGIGRQAAMTILNARLYETERQRVRELDALRATIQDISTELELSGLFKSILERAVVLLNGSGGELGLYEEKGNRLWIAASYHMEKDMTGIDLGIQYQTGVMATVARTGEPILVSDYSTWDNRMPQYDGTEIHAAMAVPMRSGNRLVGVLGIIKTQPGAGFEPSDEHLLTLFAQQAAIAVTNARLYDEAVYSAKRRTILHEASQQIISVLDAEKIYELIYSAVLKLVPVEYFFIALFDEAKWEFYTVMIIDIRVNEKLPPAHFPADQGLSGNVLATRKSLHLDDMDDDIVEKLGGKRVTASDNTLPRSALVVPLISRGKFLGVLSAQTYNPHAYSEEDRELMELLAAQAAISLDNALLFSEIQLLAITDPLTGLFNRRHFYTLATREWERAHRYNSTLSIIMLDIDHFKQFNDQFGHLTGDQVLQIVAKRCHENLRQVDLISRYGGEEFVILLPETNLDNAHRVAEKLRSAVGNSRLETEQGKFPITISLGVAEIDNSCPNLDMLLDRADQAMYISKRAGRNQTSIWKSTEEN